MSSASAETSASTNPSSQHIRLAGATALGVGGMMGAGLFSLLGLASQHAFLCSPHLELTVNLRYATAIAWLLIEQQKIAIPPADDLLGMARIWRQAFEPHGRLRDFAHAWRTCVLPLNQVA